MISEHRAILYEVADCFGTEPIHRLTDAELRLRYRQRFFRGWLIFEVAPSIGFPEDHE